jgi:CRP/FNR family transcriptional regulator, cyclic AMP receptor protein
MPQEFRLALLDLCQWQQFKAGDTIYVAGDSPGGIYGICEGALAMTSGSGSPVSPAAHLGGPGTWTGLGPLITGQPRRGTMQAMTPLLLAHVPLGALQALLHDHPEWWRHIAQALLMEFDTAITAVNDLLLRSGTGRCAATLLRIADCRRQDLHADQPAPARISQHMLAEMANLSRSRISPILAEFSKRKLIRLEYRVIWLLDVPALRAIADEILNSRSA